MKKNVIGVLSVIPGIYIVFFMVVVLSIFLSGANSNWMMSVIVFIFIIHFLMMGLNIFLLIVFIKHVIDNETLDQNHRVMWILGILVALPISMPIYWFIYIRHEDGFTFF